MSQSVNSGKIGYMISRGLVIPSVRIFPERYHIIVYKNSNNPCIPETMFGKDPCSITSAIICVHKANSKGKRNCDQYVELVEPFRAAEQRSVDVKKIHNHTSSPTSADDQKW